MVSRPGLNDRPDLSGIVRLLATLAVDQFLKERTAEREPAEKPEADSATSDDDD